MISSNSRICGEMRLQIKQIIDKVKREQKITLSSSQASKILALSYRTNQVELVKNGRKITIKVKQ